MLESHNISLDNANIIDIGCGDGTFSRFLESKYKNINKIIGIDISSKMIEQANIKMRENELSKIKFYECDGRDLNSLLNISDINTDSFDIAIMIYVLNCISNKNDCLKDW